MNRQTKEALRKILKEFDWVQDEGYKKEICLRLEARGIKTTSLKKEVCPKTVTAIFLRLRNR